MTILSEGLFNKKIKLKCLYLARDVLVDAQVNADDATWPCAEGDGANVDEIISIAKRFEAYINSNLRPVAK